LRAQPLEAGALQLVERPCFGSCQQLQSRFGRTGLVVGLRGGQLTLDAVRRIRSQLGGSLEKRGCGGEPATFSAAVGRALELESDLFIRCERGLGAVPRTAIGIDLGIGRCCQSLMCAPSLHGLSCAVDRRTQEGVAKGHPGAERQQSRRFRRSRCLRAELEALGCAPQQRRIADRLGRRDEQQALALGG
jgi:hypothetical protein